MCCENYYKQLHPVLFLYHLVLIVYTNPTCQSNATVDVCATVLSKSQNAFFSISSLIKERKEIFCVIKESLSPRRGTYVKVTYATVPLEMQETQGKPLHHHSDAPQIPPISHLLPSPLSPPVRGHHVGRGTYAHLLRALPLVAPW